MTEETLKENEFCKISLLKENGEPKLITKTFSDEKFFAKELRLIQSLSSAVPAEADNQKLTFPYLTELSNIIQTPSSEEAATDLIRQCIGILAELKSKTIVHRDIKPGNLYLNDQARLFLNDFETALETEGQISENTCGTPGFMAPEQYSSSKVDWLADQYSFGAVIFNILTGTKPFKSGTKEELFELQKSAIPDPSLINAKLKKPFCELTRKMMDPDKKKRYQSIEDLYRAVQLCAASIQKKEILDNKVVRIEKIINKKSKKSQLPLILYIIAALILAALAFKLI